MPLIKKSVGISIHYACWQIGPSSNMHGRCMPTLFAEGLVEEGKLALEITWHKSQVSADNMAAPRPDRMQEGGVTLSLIFFVRKEMSLYR